MRLTFYVPLVSLPSAATATAHSKPTCRRGRQRSSTTFDRWHGCCDRPREDIRSRKIHLSGAGQGFGKRAAGQQHYPHERRFSWSLSVCTDDRRRRRGQQVQEEGHKANLGAIKVSTLCCVSSNELRATICCRRDFFKIVVFFLSHSSRPSSCTSSLRQSPFHPFCHMRYRPILVTSS